MMKEEFDIFQFLTPENYELIPSPKKSKVNFSNEDSNTKFQLSTLALIMSLFANDLKFIHLNAIGDDFDKVHSISEELYDKASEDSDTLAELAIRNNESVPNFTDAGKIIPYEIYKSIPDSNKFSMGEFKISLDVKGHDLLNALKKLDESYSSEVKSKIDEIIDYWSKEIDYKNNQRFKITESLNFSRSEKLKDVILSRRNKRLQK